jgi:hypothetical protein
MYPVEASTEVSLARQDSALKRSADAFCELAESEDWVIESQGLASVARALFDGEEMSDGTATYAVTIDAASGAPSTVLNALLSDIVAAGSALDDLNVQAAGYLRNEAETVPSRRDVMRFERALIWAGKAERGFSNAADILSERGIDTGEAKTALERLSREIDETRDLADALADRYAQRQDTVSS